MVFGMNKNGGGSYRCGNGWIVMICASGTAPLRDDGRREDSCPGTGSWVELRLKLR